MRSTAKSRSAIFIAHAFALLLPIFGMPAIAAPDNIGQVLKHADQIKLGNNDQFQIELKQLDTQSNQLTAQQRDWLDYLHAWQLGYQGDYPKALTAFNALLARTHDSTVRARARISRLYDQINSSHYEDAFENSSALLDSLPEVEDKNAHFLILISASDLYISAGQYELALRYIDQALAYDSSDSSTCIVMSSKVDVLYRIGKLDAGDPKILAGIDTCQRIGDAVDVDDIHLKLAQAQLDHDDAAGALKLLNAHDAQVVATHSSALTSDFHSVMARAYLRIGDLPQARKFAQSAVDFANKQEYSESVADAYKVLYKIAKRQNDDHDALAYHEKFAAADKGYLNNTSARALAFQVVHQQVLDKKRQIDTLSEQNKMLQLKQQIDEKSTETRGLYVLLLLAGLALVAMWAWRTKRSQIKFQTLARHDGLTGISNRQHFFEAAQDSLRYCAKNARDAVVIAMDLDHFKAINDMHGHAAGDATLKRVVGACKERLHSIDIFGRLGGEEFAILMPDCNAAVATKRADEMRATIAGLSAVANARNDVVVTASFGIAVTSVCGYSLTTLLAHADNALYSAKHAGRNRVVVHRAGADAKQSKPSGGIDVSESTDV
ncbi:MAG: GGDEF domain-containing protein [Rudaea sp.]